MSIREFIYIGALIVISLALVVAILSVALFHRDRSDNMLQPAAYAFAVAYCWLIVLAGPNQ